MAQEMQRDYPRGYHNIPNPPVVNELLPLGTPVPLEAIRHANIQVPPFTRQARIGGSKTHRQIDFLGADDLVIESYSLDYHDARRIFPDHFNNIPPNYDIGLPTPQPKMEWWEWAAGGAATLAVISLVTWLIRKFF